MASSRKLMTTPLCFVVDSKFLPFAIAQALEILRTEPAFEPHIFLESPDAPSWLRRIDSGVTIHHDKLRPHVPKQLPSSTKWPAVVYGRIFLPRVLPDPRIVYIDADVARVRSLSELASIDLGNNAIGAVHDAGLFGDAGPGLPIPVPVWFKNLGLRRRRYFNTGVLLMNSTAWSSRDLASDMADYFSRFGAHVRNWDQDFLNYQFQDSWAELSPKWNYQTSLFGHDFESTFEPALIHFTDTVKPWHWRRFNWSADAMTYYERLFSYIPREAHDLIQQPPDLKLEKRLKIALWNRLYQAGLRTGRIEQRRAHWRTQHAEFARHYAQGFADGSIVGQTLDNFSFAHRTEPLFNGLDYRCDAPQLVPASALR